MLIIGFWRAGFRVIKRVHYQVHVFQGNNTQKSFVPGGKDYRVACGIPIFPNDSDQFGNGAFLRYIDDSSRSDKQRAP
jgi:hypothetical protein